MKAVRKKYEKNLNDANVIFRIRTEHNLTQKELADLINVSDRTVSKWENDLTVPDLNSIRNICSALDISPSYIINANKTYKDSFKKANKKIFNFFNYLLNHIFVFGFIIAFSLLLIFFLNNYSTNGFYSMKYTSENITFDRGYFISNKYLNILVIDNIDLSKLDYDPAELKLELYTYVNGDKYVIYEAEDLEDIYIEELSGYPVVLNSSTISGVKKNLYLIISAKDKDDKTYTYDMIIELSDEFVNNKIAYNDYLKDETFDKYPKLISHKLPTFSSYGNIRYNFIDNSMPVFSHYKKLENLGFKYDREKSIYIKISKKEKIEYSPNYNLLSYKKIVNDITISIDYYFKTPKINYTLYKNSGKNISKIVNLQYNVLDSSVACIYGECDNYMDDIKHVLNLYEEIDKALQM